MTGKNEGIVVTHGTLTASQIAVGRGATATTTRFGRGSNVNMGSTMSGAQQSAAAGVSDPPDLQLLLKSLAELLQTTPPEKAEQSDAVAMQASHLVEAAAKEKPNRTMLQSLASGLKQTASFLKDTVPEAFAIVSQITTIVGQLHGFGL